MGRPDFYLSFAEHETLSGTRACYVLHELVGPRGRYWHVRIEPPLPLLGMPDAGEVVLAERFLEDDLSNIGKVLIPVYVCRIINADAVQQGKIGEKDIGLVAWGEAAKNPATLSRVAVKKES